MELPQRERSTRHQRGCIHVAVSCAARLSRVVTSVLHTVCRDAPDRSEDSRAIAGAGCNSRYSRRVGCSRWDGVLSRRRIRS